MRRLRVTCRPKDQDYFTFSYNDLLKMCVTAQDSCDNFVNCITGYEAVIDTTLPAIIYAWPEDEDTQLSISSGINLTLRDEIAGVDIQYVRIEMKVLQHYEEIPT
ncbi:hypothetical protein KAH55_05035, partial [bacterium]|nr:hypothetical protein [bacterium]